jgi:hypothetical protein
MPRFAARAIRVERFGRPDVLRMVSVEARAQSWRGAGAGGRVGVDSGVWKVCAGGAGERSGRPPYLPGWDIPGQRGTQAITG